MCVILPGCPTKAWRKTTTKKKKKKKAQWTPPCPGLSDSCVKCFSSGVKGNVGEVVSPPLLVLMSECLRRAPWKRSVGSCWTAKGASSGEVRPLFYYLYCCCCCCSTGGRERSRLDTTRQRAGRQAGRQTGGALLLSCLAVNMLQAGPVFLACLNANTP